MKFKKVLAAGIAAVMAISSLTLPTFADIGYEYLGSSSGLGSYDAQIGDFIVNLGDSYEEYAVTIVGYVGTDTVVNIPKELSTSEFVLGEDPYGKIAKIMDEYDTLKILRVTMNAFPETVTAITADTNSENFTAVDGVLYNKDVTMLISIPGGKSSITLPATVNRMGDDYIEGNSDYSADYNYDKEGMLFSNEIYKVYTLKEIKVAADNKTFKSEDGILYSADGKWLVAYPSGKEAKEYSIPEGVEKIAVKYFTNPNLEKIKFASTTVSMVIYEDGTCAPICPALFFYCKNLQEIGVAEGNTKYVSKDGVLFSYSTHFDVEEMKDVLTMDTLVSYPCGKQDKEYTVSKEIYKFEWAPVRPLVDRAGPFYNNPYIETVTFENPDFYLINNDFYDLDIPMMLFNNCTNFKTIKGYVGSTVEKYMSYDQYENVNNYDYWATGYPFDGGMSNSIVVDSLPYKFVPITYTVEDTNKTGAEVEGALPYATTLNVEKTDESETSVTFDITLADKDGNAVQPTEAVSVKLPVPEGMATEGLKVYRAESNGKYTDMKATFADGSMTFTTDHFSTYVITAEELDKEQSGGSGSSGGSTGGSGSSSGSTGSAGSESASDTAAPETSSDTSASSTEGSTAGSTDSEDKNQNTGVALLVLPAAIAAAGIVISRKRR